jgi:putative membrane-bound dehydrogenase-like protein
MLIGGFVASTFGLRWKKPRQMVYKATFPALLMVCPMKTKFCLALFAITWFAPRLESASPIVDAPLSPGEAARTMIVPEGFNVTLFAGEPDVMQPVGFCIDDRGRLWVAEAYNYPDHGTRPGDRIVILEDTDHDGRFDKRTVFYDQLNYVSGIEVGFGGAWIMSPPYFYFIPDRDGDLKPDGPPVVLLDGFGNHANAHNMANGFSWGPDGWLYGTHGRTNWSTPDKPGTPQSQRMRFDGGVWRYHPILHIWEPFSDGTTNPWGIDWDDYGQGFVCNCVEPHLFHVIQGAHYEPWRNYESSRFAYERIASIADHLHFLGAADVHVGIGSDAELALGGGHAHSGTMIYLGDNWPESYRNTVFMNNIHGHRVNHDLLERRGSGYTAAHAPDLMIAKDPWFMGVTIRYGPDGAVFVSDWSDTGECHSTRNTRKTTGRIFKISYGKPKPFTLALASMADDELVNLQLHRNDWLVQHARRLLQERFAGGKNMSEVHRSLREIFVSNPDITRQLRALWTLHVTGGTDDAFLSVQLSHENEHVRAWAVRLMCEDRDPPERVQPLFQRLAEQGNSALVRLHLCSALQRLPPSRRWELAAALAGRDEDQSDQNLPLMLWYALEPLVHENLERFVSFAIEAKIPLIRRHAARRAVSLPEAAGLQAVTRALLRTSSDEVRKDLLAGTLKGLEGRRDISAPNDWPEIYTQLRSSPDSSLVEQATRLALIFDDPSALQWLHERANNRGLTPEERQRAIAALVARKPGNLPDLLFSLIADSATRSQALRGLAEFTDPRTPSVILEHYEALDAPSRQDALQTLASRANWAMALMKAIEIKRVARNDLSAFTARQLRNLNDANLNERVNSLWGEVRATAADKKALIDQLRRRLTPPTLAQADLANGRAVFQQACAVCHKLFGEGNNLAPDLTGSQRGNLDYVLENVIDPSASVAQDYRMLIIETTGDRTLNGFLTGETETTLTLRTLNEELVIPKAEVRRQTLSSLSIMPEGLLDGLTPEQVQDLVAYLAVPRQVPLPPAVPPTQPKP